MNNLKLISLFIFSIAALFLGGCYTQLETVKDDYEKSSQTTVSNNVYGLQAYQYTGGGFNNNYYSPFRTSSYFSNGFFRYSGMYNSLRYSYGYIPGYGYGYGFNYHYGYGNSCGFKLGYGCGYYYDNPNYFTGYSTRPNNTEQLRSSGLYASADRGDRRSRTSVSSNIQSVRSNSITSTENTRINQLTTNTRSNSNGVNKRQSGYNVNSTGDNQIRSRGTSITNSPSSGGLKSRKEQRANLNPESPISRRELKSVYADNRAKNAQRSIIQNKYSSVDPETDDFYYLYRFSQVLRNGGPQHTLVLGGYSNNPSVYSWENRRNSTSVSNSRGVNNNWQRSQSSRVSGSRSTSSVRSAGTTTVRSRSTSSNRSQRSGSSGSRTKSRSGGDDGSNSRSSGSNN